MVRGGSRQLGGRPLTGHLVLLKLLQETPTTMALSSRLTRVRARWRAARNSTGSLPAQRAHSNAPAAPADCQCYPGRRASEPGRWPAARTAPSSSASPAATSTAQGSRVGGLPPSCRATPHPRHPASGSQLRGCAKPYQNWHGSRAAREPRRSLQRLQRQRAYAHATTPDR